MNDLYRRIGVEAATNDQELIRRSIREMASVDPASARVAEQILLNPKRKLVYDRAYEVVSRIGQVRSSLGLSQTPAWLETHSGDFDKPQVTPHSSRPAKRDPNTGLRECVLAVLIGLPLLAALGSWISTSLRRPAPPSVGTRSFPEIQRLAENTAVVKIADPEVAATSPPRPEDPSLVTARERVRARSRSIGRTLTEAEVDEYAIRLTSGPSEPTPATGVIFRSFQADASAPFEVKTRPGSNYYIKVVTAGDESTVLTAFIRGGEPFETTLPVGTYKVRYAAGEKWYGPMLDFGLAAACSRCDDRFEFRRTISGYTGYTLELILQRNGNLRTSQIDPDEF